MKRLWLFRHLLKPETATRNDRNDRNDRNETSKTNNRNDQNETIETKLSKRNDCNGFVSVVTVVSFSIVLFWSFRWFRLFQLFRFGRFASLFRVLVHAGYLPSSNAILDKVFFFNALCFHLRCTDRDVWIANKRLGVFFLRARPSPSTAAVKRLKEKQ